MLLMSFVLIGNQSCKDDDKPDVKDDTKQKDSTTKNEKCELTSLSGLDGEYKFEYNGDKIVQIKADDEVYDIEYDGDKYKKMTMNSNGIDYEWTFVYSGDKVSRVNKKENSQDKEYMEYTWSGEDIVKITEYVNFTGSFELDFVANLTYSNNNLVSFETGEIVDEEFESDFSLENIKVDDRVNPMYRHRELFLVLDIGVFFNFSKNNIVEAGIVTEFLPFPLNLKFSTKYNDKKLPTNLKGDAGGFDIDVNFGYSCD